jgi:hypothetical protein
MVLRVCVLSALIAGGLLSGATAPQRFHRPLVFEPNQGQAPAQFKWLGRSSSYQVLLDSESATIVIPNKKDLQAASTRLPGTRKRLRLNYSALRMKLAGSRPWRDISGSEPTSGVSNYLNNRDLKRSVNQIPQYGRVKVANVYKSIDLIFYTNGGDLEYDFAVAPGANPEQIQVAFEETKQMRVDAKSGDLIVKLPGGSEIRQLKPKVYQQIGERRLEIAGGYRLLEHERAAFTVTGYDRSHALVIDPRLTISRSFAGNQDDEANAIAVDANGNTFITGSTFSLNFPVTNNSEFLHPKPCGSFPFDPGFCGSLESDAFIAEVTSDGSIGFVTYDGVGSGNGIAVDSSGIYVTGQEIQPDSDVNNFPFDNDNGELFVQRLSLTGQGIYFTFAGGPGEGFGIGEDFGNGIALDDLHNAWAVGATNRTGGTIPPGDVLVVKVAPDGTKLVQRIFSSDGDDAGMGVAVADRKPWITGKTCGNGFPTTDGIVHQLNHCAVFVVQMDEAGNRTMGMVFGGVDGDDVGVAIATNGSNAVYVTGYGSSIIFPTTTGGEIGPQGTFTYVNPRGFVTEVESFGKIVRSMVLPAPDGFVRPYAIANDERGRGVYVAGSTSSPFFPGSEPVCPVASTIGFVSKFSPELSQLRYTVILGQALSAVALRGPSPVFPEVYVAGWEDGGTFGRDAFMVKMLEEAPASRMSANTSPQVFQNSFAVSWAGSSPLLSAVTFDVFVSDNGGPFTPFQTATTDTSATFTGVPGHTYGLFSIATDAGGNREPVKTRAEIVVQVIDPTPPIINPQITGTLGNNGWYRSAVAANWSVSDPESGIASSAGCAPTNLTGDTAGVSLTCSASNGVGLSTSVPITIKVDKTPPAISGMPATGCSLWPPNRKLVQVATIKATDTLSGLVPGSLTVTGTSNEPSSDPNDPEIVITPNRSGGFTVQLQAERLGSGNGRIYTINATAMDNAGNSASATATCTVPHDQGAK